MNLNDQELAMFKKLSGGLFDRLDAGANGSNDGWVSIKDIENAITTSWKLHDSEKSAKVCWKDPLVKSGMSKQDAKDFALDFLDQTLIGNMTNSTVLDNVISRRQYSGKFVDDNIVRALMALRVDLENADTNNDDWVSISEVENWKI